MKNSNTYKMVVSISAIVIFLQFITMGNVNGYSTYRYNWPSPGTSYVVDSSFSNSGPGWLNSAFTAANSWSNSSAGFNYFYNSGSVNRITARNGIGSLGLTRPFYNPDNTIHHFVMEIDNGGGFAFYDGTQSPTVPLNYFDLQSVVRHELGHGLGLCHNAAANNLMSAGLAQGATYSIDSDAINGTKYLYNSSYSGPPPLTTCDLFNNPVVAQAYNTYDDRNEVVRYGGKPSDWLAYSSGLSIQGTTSQTVVNGSRSNITFDGSQISVVYDMSPSSGSATVYLDNSIVGSIQAYSQETRKQIIKTWDAGFYGRHTFEIRSNSSNPINVDAYAINIASVPAGYYDNTNSQFRYFQVGSWVNATGVSGAYNGTHSLTDIAGSFFRFTFTGSSATYYFTKAYNRGWAVVTIDGVDKGYINLYNSGVIRQQSVTFSGLGYGTHVINITCLGIRDPASSGQFIDVDFLVVN